MAILPWLSAVFVFVGVATLVAHAVRPGADPAWRQRGLMIGMIIEMPGLLLFALSLQSQRGSMTPILCLLVGMVGGGIVGFIRSRM